MRFDDERWADAVWRRGLGPSPTMTVSEWADRHRVLPNTSAEPGPWRTARTPYLREIMDALSEDSPYERVVVMAGSQVGKTEVGLNWVGYCIHHAPGLALMVMPSLDMVKRNVRTRIDPMIEATPPLRALVGPVKSKDRGNSLFLKEFLGGQLVMTGANSGASLRSTPARYLFLDEVDAYPGDVDGEGDPVDLAVRRTATFRSQRKILMVSTPTIAGLSRIETAYAESDRRKLFVPCLQCGDMAPVTWARIRWLEDRRDQAHMFCEACGGIAEDRDKPKLLAGAEWRAEGGGDGKTAGFHLPGLLSPFESWGTCAIEHGKAKTDPSRLQVWTNTVLAESWLDRQGEEIDDTSLFARREPWSGRIPARAFLLTAGVDTQDDRIECQVIAWGAGEECWVVAYRVFLGDPSSAKVWQDLDDFLLSTYPHELDIAPLSVQAACIDTGGHNTRAVYEFCRTRHARRVWGIKGANLPGKPAWPRRPSYKNRGSVPLYEIGSDTLKDTLAARLSVKEEGPGCIHFPAFLGPDYFRQFTSEHRITKFVRGRPKRMWELRRGQLRNEALDTFVYALAALSGLISAGVDLEAEALRFANIPILGPGSATPRIVRSSFMNR